MTPLDTTSRFARRRVMTRLVALRPFLIGATVFVVVAFAAWAVFFSSWLAAQHVSVGGETTVSAADIEAAAGVSMGTPMARLDISQIQQRVAALPAVQSVTVHRSWPHTVSIFVVERKPVAAIHRDGAWWDLDDQGVLFRKTAGRDKDVPVIAVSRQGGSDAVSEAASVIASLPSSLLAETKRLTAESMDSITLRMRNNSSIIWGSSSESDRKVEVAEALLAHTKATTYNVSVPEQPATSN